MRKYLDNPTGGRGRRRCPETMTRICLNAHLSTPMHLDAQKKSMGHLQPAGEHQGERGGHPKTMRETKAQKFAVVWRWPSNVATSTGKSRQSSRAHWNAWQLPLRNGPPTMKPRGKKTTRTAQKRGNLWPYLRTPKPQRRCDPVEMPQAENGGTCRRGRTSL